jgi:predicted enzyme related to lactoylglutathione lyase
MQVHYLEVVTPEVDVTCEALAKMHGVTFGEPEAGLGNSRTATLANGGKIGVRAPMHEAEEPVVRPYLLVDDIESAVAAAAEAGGEIAHPPMELPGHGTFAIYFQGGIQYGLWQI